jgi:hypothetical protein
MAMKAATTPCRYARRWAVEHGQATAAAFVPLSFAPGEAYQFDWSHEVVLLSGVTVTVKVARWRGIAQMSRNRSSSLPSQCRNGRTMYHRHGHQ